MVVHVGIAYSLAEAQLSLKHYSVGCEYVDFIDIGPATSSTALMQARKYSPQNILYKGRLVLFHYVGAVVGRRRRTRRRCKQVPYSTRMYAYAVF